MRYVSIEELELIYESIIRPSVLLRLDEIETWIGDAPEEDIKAFIKAAEEWEDYEHAAEGLRVLKNRTTLQ